MESLQTGLLPGKESVMKADLLSLEDVRMLLKGLECLAEEVRSSKEERQIEQALAKISDLKAKLEEGQLCEAGSEEICASTRIGVFW